MLLIQGSLCYFPKDLEDRKAWYVYIYYTWCDIVLIFKLHRRTRLTPRSSIHSLKIRITSHPCNKYEHTTLSYLLSVKYYYSYYYFISPLDCPLTLYLSSRATLIYHNHLHVALLEQSLCLVNSCVNLLVLFQCRRWISFSL